MANLNITTRNKTYKLSIDKNKKSYGLNIFTRDKPYNFTIDATKDSIMTVTWANNKIDTFTIPKTYTPDVPIKELCSHCSDISGKVYKLNPGTAYTFDPNAVDGLYPYTYGLKLYFTIIKNTDLTFDIKIKTDQKITNSIKENLTGCTHLNKFTNSCPIRHINNDGSFQDLKDSKDPDSNDNFGTWDGREILIKNGGIISRGSYHIIIGGDRICTDYWTHSKDPTEEYLMPGITPPLGKPLSMSDCNIS